MDDFKRHIVFEDNGDNTVTVSYFLVPETEPQKIVMAIGFNTFIEGVAPPEVVDGAASIGLNKDSITIIPDSLDD